MIVSTSMLVAARLYTRAAAPLEVPRPNPNPREAVSAGGIEGQLGKIATRADSPPEFQHNGAYAPRLRVSLVATAPLLHARSRLSQIDRWRVALNRGCTGCPDTGGGAAGAHPASGDGGGARLGKRWPTPLPHPCELTPYFADSATCSRLGVLTRLRVGTGGGGPGAVHQPRRHTRGAGTGCGHAALGARCAAAA